MADGEIDVEIRVGVADPDASIRRIAAANKATILGSNAEMRIYQLHFNGYSPSELAHFSDKLDADPDVKNSSLALMMSAGSDDPRLPQ